MHTTILAIWWMISFKWNEILNKYSVLRRKEIYLWFGLFWTAVAGGAVFYVHVVVNFFLSLFFFLFLVEVMWKIAWVKLKRNGIFFLHIMLRYSEIDCINSFVKNTFYFAWLYHKMFFFSLSHMFIDVIESLIDILLLIFNLLIYNETIRLHFKTVDLSTSWDHTK